MCNAYQMVLFLENVISALIMRFLAKSQKTSNVAKIGKYDAERVFFREKNVLIFFKAFFTKVGGSNYAAGARESCY